MTTRLTRRERRANGEILTNGVSQSRQGPSRRRTRNDFRRVRAKPSHAMSLSARGMLQVAGVTTAGMGVLLSSAIPNNNFLALEQQPDSSEIIVDNNSAAVSVRSGGKADIPLAFTEDDADGKMRSLTSGGRKKVAESNDTAGVFSYPIPGAEKTSSFGSRVNPLTGESGEFHEGQDFAAFCGSDVMVAGTGVVKEVGWHAHGGGLRIVVDHGSGLATTYNYLSASKVKAGDSVSRGEVIASAGTTGASTGCHLHSEVMVDGQKVDPIKWL